MGTGVQGIGNLWMTRNTILPLEKDLGCPISAIYVKESDKNKHGRKINKRFGVEPTSASLCLKQIVKNYQIISDIPPRDYRFAGNSHGQKQAPKYVYPDKAPTRTLLDIGFGLGELGRIVKTDNSTQHWHIDGIDGCFFDTCCNVDLFKKEYYRNIWHGLAQDIPVQLNAYDMICLFDVIEHLDADNAKQLLKNLLGALGDDSFLILSVGGHQTAVISGHMLAFVLEPLT